MQVIGHRGAAALAPENTWAGFDVAVSLGVDAIETDVRATSDGTLILLFQDAKFYLLIRVCIYCSLPKERSPP